MAITTAWCTSHKVELANALHNHGVGQHTFKAALYLSTANLDATTQAYTATGEVSGTNYTAGGENCVNVAPTSSGTTAYWQFQNIVWTNLTVTGIAGCMFYNSTATNRSVSVHNFGQSYSPSAVDFTIQMPTFDASNALYRLV